MISQAVRNAKSLPSTFVNILITSTIALVLQWGYEISMAGTPGLILVVAAVIASRYGSVREGLGVISLCGAAEVIRMLVGYGPWSNALMLGTMHISVLWIVGGLAARLADASKMWFGKYSTFSGGPPLADCLMHWCAKADSNVLLLVGPQAEAMFGYTKEEWYSEGFWTSIIFPEDREWVLKAREAHIATNSSFELEYRMLTQAGRILWVRDTVSLRHDEHGDLMLYGILIDISDLKLAQLQLVREKERAQTTLRSIADGVITTDAAGRVEQMNPVAERLTGWMEIDAKGLPLSEVFKILDDRSREPLESPLNRTLRDKKVMGLGNHTLLISRTGRERAIELSVAPIALASEIAIGTVLVFHDVTEQRRLVNAIKHQATHDPLTGLVNRREFENRLHRVVSRLSETHADHALLYMDLDQFKLVNDSCGHSAGDELLRQLSHNLLRHVRERDTLARLGGDEFALLMEHCNPQQALRVAGKMLVETREFRFHCNHQVFQVGVSIGVVPINGTGHRAEDILRSADHACYIAKENGRNRVYVHQEDTPDLIRRQQEMGWITRLYEAINNDRLTLCYQTIRPLDGNDDHGEHWEILLRMREPDGQLLLPGAFLPAAERYDLMPTLDRWVVQHTLEWLANHNETYNGLELCTINVSTRTIGDEGFLIYVEDMLAKTHIDPAKLCFEITETAAIANLQKTLTFINALKERGCRFALDDFGTGMASFSYLKQLPVDFIKIDGSFVETIADSDIDTEMVRSINDISHIMGRRTIAEFVSDKAVMDKLANLGVDYAQGYYISRPRELSDAA